MFNSGIFGLPRLSTKVRDDRTNRTPVRDRPGALGWRRGS
jgi:hypothetical protein